jgi:hypothetical protein
MSRKNNRHNKHSRNIDRKTRREAHLLAQAAFNGTTEPVRPASTAPTATMTWTHRKSGETGTFAALVPEVMSGVPLALDASPAERIAMFHKVTRRLNEAAAGGNHTGHVTIEIPWNMLDFPPDDAGREYHANSGHIGYICKHYHANSWTNPVVNVLPIYDEDGNLLTVYFYVPDGWHRTRVRIEMHYANCPADLHTNNNPLKIEVGAALVTSTKEVAEAFCNNNGGFGKLPMAGSDEWRNQYIAGHPAVVETVEFAKQYGLDAAATPNKRGWPRFPNGKCLMHMMNGARYHFPHIARSDVETAMELLTNPACAGLFRNKNALKQNFFGGLCHFIAYYARPGYVHEHGLVYMFSDASIVSRIEALTKETSKALLVVELGVEEGRLSREESMRYHARAAAMRKIYMTLVPPPNKRGSNWHECPAELRQLLHVAPKIENAAERRQFIARHNSALQKKLKSSAKAQRTKIVAT